MKRSREGLAKNVTVGMRFPSAQVVRFCDAKAVQLARALMADGRFRVVVFAGDIRKEKSKRRLDALAEYLNSEESPIRRFTKPEDDVDSVIEPILVLNGERVQMEQDMIPNVFWPVTGKWKMRGMLFSDHTLNYG
jgi:phenol 2-monooxygenase